MTRRPSEVKDMPISGSGNGGGGSGTTQDAHLAYRTRIDSASKCLRLLLSPSQSNSKAWRLVYPPPGSNTNSSNTTTTNTGPSVSSAATAASLPSTSKNDQLPTDLSISSPSHSTLDHATNMLGQPISIQVHRRAATRSSKDLDSSKATLTSASNSVLNASTSLLPPNSSMGADIFRAVCYIPIKDGEELNDLAWIDIQDAFRRLIATPECRPIWDQIVEESEVMEEVDTETRICRTVFKLGWPASPRDAITVSRTTMDSNILIDVSCSLPRSPDAPAYLRPAPPFVRSHVNLFAWCLERAVYAEKNQPCVKLTAFWSWDLRGAWIGMPAGGIGARLPTLISSLVRHVKAGDTLRVPFLSHYGRNVELTSRTFTSSRDMVTVEYQVICDDDTGSKADQITDDSVDRDLRLEWSLPSAEGWDVHIDVKPLDNHKHSSVDWKYTATQVSKGDWQSAQISLILQHMRSEGPNGRSLLAEGLRGKITVQRIAASQDVRLRINDVPYIVEKISAPVRVPSISDNDALISAAVPALVDDTSSVSNMSLHSELSTSTNTTTTLGEDMLRRATTPPNASGIAMTIGSPIQASLSTGRPAPDRNTAIASMIRRNYIYFTSLLQEPEAKWKHFSDNRGVTITQLDSIDPTLVVYRAEATFVGVGVWDLFAAIANAGVKNSWDKGAEESKLIEDLGDSSKVWWNKIRGTWPVAARDSVVVETVYKSPSSIHLFSFSCDDRKLFPTVPSPDPGAIRTQIDLRGWSIESLSPTTAHITLIEQSDPKGWTSKSSATPGAMTAAVAGVGDFAIKQGGPPITTRLLGAKMRMMKYETDKSSFRVEYDLVNNHSDDLSGNVECEIRCDVETWSPSLDVVVDPPPINVSCLCRHKLSQGGSGLWLTIEQPIASLEDDASRITVRKANNKEKGVVYVNGARIKVDMDDLKEDEVAQLREQKRTKPKRVPLDLVSESPKKPLIGSSSPIGPLSRAGTPASAPALNTATATGAVGGMNSSKNPTSQSAPHDVTTMDVFSDERPRQPMTCALDVLFLLRRIHAERSPDPAGNPAGWTLVANRGGLYTRRKMMQSISPTVIVQRADKVVEGLMAEDLLSIITNIGSRKIWDEKVDSTTNLESYGNGASTGFFTTKASFPFRGRAFNLASLTARSGPGTSQFGNPSAPTVYFHASSSYPISQSAFSLAKINPTGLPMGKVLIDGWILETLDPYSSTLNYQIPSTRVTHLIAVDYAGSLPVTVNAMWNTQLSRSIVHVEDYLKASGTLPVLRAPPFGVEVLGDGRDEDHDLIWSLTDDKSKRACTLLSNDFDSSTKIYSVSISLSSASPLAEEVITPIAVPFPRRTAFSNASSTRGFAAAASMLPSPTLDSNLSSPSEAMMAESNNETGGTGLSRATSVSSLRSTKSKSRPSVIRKEMKKPVDLVTVDVEVELRHYEQGYNVILRSKLGEEKEKKEEVSGDDEISLSAETPKALPSNLQKEFPTIHKDEKEASTTEEDAYIWPLDSIREKDEDLPLNVSIYDLPPSAVLAATLDPSARPKKHLVRITLPTATFLDTARSNPLCGPELENAPDWFEKLRERGALISLELRPRKMEEGNQSFDNHTDQKLKQTSGSSTPSDSGLSDQGELDSQQVAVFYKNERISVTHVNKTSAMLQRESDNEYVYAVLKRVLPPPPPRAEGQPTPAGAKLHRRSDSVQPNGLEDRLPLSLQKPLARVSKFVRDESEEAMDGGANGKLGGNQENQAGNDVLSPSSSVGDTTIGLTPVGTRKGLITPSTSISGNVSSSTPTPAMRNGTTTSPTSAASAQIMSILNSYPLSRLGGGAASTAVSTTVASGGLFSRKTDGEGTGEGKSAKETENGNKVNGGEKEGQKSSGNVDEESKIMPGQLIFATEQIRKRIIDVRFTWSTLILVALIAFLFGSLIRSLLEPADFILVKELKGELGKGGGAQAIEAAAISEIKRLFNSGQGPQAGQPGVEVGGHSVAWRELKRLLELRNLFGGRWDLVIAAVRR